MRSSVTPLATSFAIVLLTATMARTQSFELSWNTIDGGGSTLSTGSNLSLGGTIGQPDAQSAPVMSGGSFQLTGGFWPGIGSTCTLPGDMNLDGYVDGDDVQLFINCVMSGTGSCGCADLDGGAAGASDVPFFVTALLGA